MTLFLLDREVDILERLAAEQDTSKSAVIRQALHLYHVVRKRIEAGERVIFKGKDTEQELLILGMRGDGDDGDTPSADAA